MNILLTSLHKFLKRNSIALIEIFNAIFASGLLALYVYYLMNPQNLNYIPDLSDYASYLIEKIVLFGGSLCLIPFITQKRVMIETVSLASISFIRILCQIYEIISGTFGVFSWMLLVLTSGVFAIVFYMVIPPLYKQICIKLRFLQK
jgi:hypothetical protein